VPPNLPPADSIVHQRAGRPAPDSEFVPGSLSLLVPGNSGRLLDPRRTPVQVAAVRRELGEFELEILGFEDAGARWVVPLWEVDRYQFARGCAERGETSSLEGAVARLDRPLSVDAAGFDASTLEGEIAALREQAGEHLPSPLTVDLDPASRTGPKELRAWLTSFMAARGLDEMEQAFATRFVRNPGSGELVKGHRIVLAELGLVSFEGRVVRDPGLFAGAWSKARRRDHILSRLAFVRELFGRADLRTVLVWRGLSTAGPLLPATNRTFVSTSFSRAVAESLFRGSEQTQVALLIRRRVPVERLFMTFLETAAMNERYLEAEAVLLYDAKDGTP